MVTLLFQIMIALGAGYGLPILVRHLGWLDDRIERIGVGGIFVAFAGIVFFTLTGDKHLTDILTFMAIATFALRSFVEWMLDCREVAVTLEAAHRQPARIIAIPHYASAGRLV